MNKKYLLFLIMIIGVLLVSGCSGSVSQEKKNNDVKILSSNESNELVTLKKAVEEKSNYILYLYRDNCPHCHKLSPVLEKIESKNDVQIVKLNLNIKENDDYYNELVEKHGFIKSEYVPFLISVVDGKISGTMSGDNYAVDNPNAELGYDINEQIVEAFLLHKES